MSIYRSREWLAIIGLLPNKALAHSFGQSYQLPMPYWMYIYGAIAALLLSFIVFGLFLRQSSATLSARSCVIPSLPWLAKLKLVTIGKIFSVTILGLCIVTGFWGSQDSYRNINMSFFWIIFVLGGVYLSALLGNWYTVFNPWRLLTQSVISRLWSGFCIGRFAYPAALAYWPAVGLYMIFIWVELFGGTRPFSLSSALLIYSALNIFGVWLIGAAHWFRYCDFFSVMFSFIARISPIEYQSQQQAGGRLRLRMPFAGLQRQNTEHFSVLIFILFMLSSTAFDGLRETRWWFNIFWNDPSGVITALAGQPPIYAYATLRPWYIAFESFCLLISPFLYLALFWFFVALAKQITRSALSTHTLCLHYTYSLLPIALVYHISHYYTLLYSQGLKVRGLFSDPFGWGWDLFGTAYVIRDYNLLDMGVIWKSQVTLILLGHVISVYLSHIEALGIYGCRRQATLSQLPMLLLMVIFTAFGLWILAQPLQGGR